MKNKLFNFFMMALIAVGLNLQGLSKAADNIDRNESGFIAKQGNKIIKTIGKYGDRHAPFSTFKIALALMGFNEKILETKDSPKWAFKKEYEEKFKTNPIFDDYTPELGNQRHWTQDHTPATFMKYSVVWFSHKITEILGEQKFQEYVSKLNYGNKDVSGTPGKNDSLLNSWLGTSLKISPRDQVDFLESLLANELPLSQEAQEKTKEIMNREEDWKGWRVYGKTGGGKGKTGWFVGWIEKEGNQPIIFAQYLNLDDPNFNKEGLSTQGSIGLIAKEVIKREILNILPETTDSK